MDAVRKNLLEETYERIINVGLCIVPYEDLSDIAAPELMLFGTTKDEKVFSFSELDAMFKSQYEQMAGFVPSLDRKRLFTRTSNDGNSAFITEEVTLTISSPEEVNTIFIRCSCVMEYVDNQWKLTHWHASTPVDTENDHWHMEEWKRENKKLQKLVDQQTADLRGKNRELEIEAAIERVRAVAMGMTKPDDMLKVCRVISDQLQQFGVELIRNVQTVIINEKKGTYHNYQYFTPYDKESFEITDCHKNPTVQAMIDRMLESPDAFFTTSLTGEELANFRSYRKKENQFPDPLLDDTKSLDGYFFSIGPGGLGITLYRPLNEDGLEIFKRFHSVFSLAYRRFRDIEKAEAQAREARIELSLERIRAQVTAMKESSDLLDIVVTMRSEFVNLGHEAHYFWHMRWLPERYEKAMTSGDGARIGMVMTLPRHIHGDIEPVAKWEKSSEPTYVLAMEPDMAVDYVDKMISLGDFERVDPQAPSLDDVRQIGGLTFIMARTTHGEIGFSLPGVVPDPPKDAVDTLVRFASVFDLAYKRFEDLKEAERQHREAQIELALERVRARTMAMQESDELAEVSSLLFQQMETLGVSTYSSGFTIWDEDQDKLISWMCNADGSMNPPFRMPIAENRWHHDQYIYWKNGKDLAIEDFTGEEMQSYFRYLRSFPLLDEAFEKSIAAGHPMPERQVHHVANFSHGNLLFITLEPCLKAHELFKRFAKVFEQTYTRFLDLQQAEEQARESEIQLALERVRARTMAMQKSEELADVAFVLFEQLRGLGGNLWGTGFGLCKENEDKDEFWFANENGVFPPVAIPNTEDPAHKKMYEGWKNKTEFLALEGSGKDLKNHYEYMMTLPEVRPFFQKILDEGLSFPEWQQWNAAYFDNGYLLIITLEPYPDKEIIKRFARVFDQTYTRFLDLKKAEAQARESEIQLALERVRARTMAMHNSEELGEVAAVMFEQISSLTSTPDRFNICIANEEDESFDVFVTDQSGYKIKNTFNAKAKNSPVIAECFKTWKNDAAHLIQDIHGKKLENWIRYMGEVVGIPFKMENVKKHRFLSSVFFSHGFIGITTHSQPQETTINLIERFAKVFQQTYTRFLDLKKAEAQARESEIQLALERVRARSMAMHQSDELADLSLELVKQVHALGIDTWFCAFNIYDDHPDGSIEWGSNGQGTFPRYRTPRKGVFLDYYEAGQRGETLLINEIGEDECPAHYDYLCSLPGVGDQLLKMKEDGIPFPTSQIDHVAFFKYGYIIFITFEPVPEAHDIFKRFAKVFQQTYTRFLDLQKAEAQAREAKIEAALERVRARSMGMHKSDDLIDVVREIGKGIHELGIQLHYSQIYTDYTYDPKTGLNIWVDVEGQDYLEKFHLPYIDHTITLNFYNALNEGLDYFSDRYSKAEKDSYFKLLFKYSDLKRIPKKRKELILNASGWTRFTVILNEATLNFGRYSLDEFTDEEHEIFIRFAKVFGQAYTRFLDLKKAEEQAREAEIEAALERVRSRSLAMHKPDELQDVVRVVAEELKNTGVILDTGGAVICTYFQDSRDVIHWTATDDPAHPSVPYLLPYFEDELFDEAWESKSRGDDYFAKVFSYDVKNAFFSHAFEHSDYRQLPDEYKKIILESKSHGIAWAWAENSAIMIPSIQGDLPSEEEKKTLIRFAKVFEQSFIRFLDLQKAEAQAREAQIEASLEKVRAQSMGMQGSEDLSKVASVMFDQMKSLGGELFAFGIVLCNKDEDTVEQWHSLGNEGMIKPFNVPVDLDYIHQYRYDQWKAGEELFSIEIPEDYITEHFNLMFELPSVKAAMDEVAGQGVDVEIPDWEIDYGASFSYGYLLVSSRKPFEETRIFPRFAKVFDQAYTRFLDLQKAEAQAREAKIEAALEKVRSRTMGMQSSDELPEVANMLFLEVQALGIPAWSSGFNILADDKKSAAAWMSSEGTLQDPFTLRLYGEASFDEMGDFLHRNEPFMVQELDGESLQEHYKYMKTFPDLKPTFKKLEEQGLSLPTYQVNHLCKFSHGFLLFITYEPVPDAHDIFKRFTNVFDQTYTRFLDLKKAESQAIEATKQASLDRVRGEIASMRSAEDLEIITPLIWNELKTLDIPFIRCGVFIIHEEDEEIEVYLSKPDGTSLAVMHLSFGSSDLVNQTVDAWRNGSVYTQHWTQEEFLVWGRSMMEQGQIPNLETYQGDEEAPGSLHLHFIPFNQGMLYVGATETLIDEEIDLSASLAEAFAIAYARYEDFVNLEKAKKAIEEALTELKATQSQLIQQEKLASLGQLTAGIAHEIKNPLNFVNNFSELSVELIEEAREELQSEKVKVKSERVTDEPPGDVSHLYKALVILDDIETNLKAIHKHGTRADSIVKSMLEHSRGGDGTMEPTNLNGLVKEFVNLSFHGMRAGKNPIDVDMEFELDGSISEVPLIAEDFSRVILNLCNNAFDACTEQSRSVMREKGIQNYSPKLTFRTKSENGKVVLEIEDNGSGIPEEMKDKILQPFFTTKKGTEGTGLGLSITNDIIKAHGGELKIKSEVGKGTAFMIILNKTN